MILYQPTKLSTRLLLGLIALIPLLLLGQPLQSRTSWFQRSPTNFWVALKQDFQLADYDANPNVQTQIRWYLKNRYYLTKLVNRAAPYLYYIHQEVKKRQLPGELTLLPMVESSYNPLAYSRAGAAGLWQIMPGTGSGFGLKQNWWYDGRLDIHDSTNAALNYLGYLHHYFEGEWLCAIAAYDAGEGTIRNALKRNKRQQKPQIFWALSLPRETHNYIPRLLALVEIIRHPEKYNVQLPDIANQPYFAKVDVGFQIDLQQAASLAGLELEELERLNPGYNRWVTAPNGPYRLLLPLDNVDKFKEALAELPEDKRVVWRRHVVKNGNSLSTIAQQYSTSIKTVKTINELKNNTIRVGDTLLIPNTVHPKKRSTQITKDRQALIKKQRRYGPKRVVHTVKSNESLRQVARRYGVKIASLRFWNRLKDNLVKPGQQLTIWIAKRRARWGKKYYTVRPGDNLSTIAKRFRVRTHDLYQWNQLDKNSALRPKQKLIVKRA